MGCCGKTINQVKSIMTGYVRYATDVKYEFTDDRIQVCRKCDEQTWMSKGEYLKWLAKNKIDILKNFAQLEKLPRLPKQEQAKGRRNLFCRICKCFVPAKARVENEKCPIGKW